MPKEIEFGTFRGEHGTPMRTKAEITDLVTGQKATYSRNQKITNGRVINAYAGPISDTYHGSKHGSKEFQTCSIQRFYGIMFLFHQLS